MDQGNKLSTIGLITLTWVLLTACGDGGSRAYRGPGTQRMAERLAQIAVTDEPGRSLDAIKASKPPPTLRGQLAFEAVFAQELLRAGQVEEAIERMELLLGEIESHRDRVAPDFALTVRELAATAYLRLGETENCVPPSSTEPCLVPTPQQAAYKNKRGPRAAVREYRRILDVQPDNLIARWLLNIAYMTLGEHPNKVPPEWLIPAQAFESDYDVKRFRDIAPELGIDVLGQSGGSIMDDFVGNGYLDIIASSRGLRNQLRYFRNNGDGSFTERTVEAGLEGLVGGLNLVQADYNNDGYLDFLVLRGAWLPEGHPNSLLRNNGDGTFEDVTEQAGLLRPWYPTQTASWGDYNNDGWVDLFVGNESAGSARNPSQLFRNNGDGTFTNVAREVGAAVIGFTKNVVWGDIDNDGMLDLHISRLDEPNVLLWNKGPDDNGRWAFRDASVDAGITEPSESFTTWFWDYDNDGWLDIFVSARWATSGDVAAEYLGLPHDAESPRLYRNNGDGTFSDVTVAVRLNKIICAMGANYGDLDNDGYLDFYIGTGYPDFRGRVPNRMFRNVGGRFFQDVTTSGGFGHIQNGHGVAFGDLDNDGDQDIYETMGGAHEGDRSYNVLFENPGHGNRWITLKLEGVRSNRAALGARIRLTVETDDGPRDFHRTVTSGGSFGASSLQQEIGLGQASAIRALTVTWPATGKTDVYNNVAMNRIYRIREGDPLPTPVTLKRLQLSGRPAR